MEFLNLSNFRCGEKQYLNTRERQQLLTELLLLDQYHGDKAEAATKWAKIQKRYKKSKNFRKDSQKGMDPTSKRYFICQAWGMGNSLSPGLKKYARDK